MGLLVGLAPLRCPGCESIDWASGDYAIAHTPSGTLEHGPVKAVIDGDAEWVCLQCGHEVDRRSDLAREFNVIRKGDLEATPGARLVTLTTA